MMKVYRKVLPILCFLMAMLGGCTSSSQPSVVHPIHPLSLQTCSSTVATNFYQALKDHNIHKAYTYFASSATGPDGQKLTYETFTHLFASSTIAQSPFTFSISSFLPNPPQVVMTINNGRWVYHSHLQVKQDGTTCPITTLDRI